MTDKISKEDIKTAIDEFKLNAKWTKQFQEGVCYAINTLEHKFLKDKPSLPEGFIPFDADEFNKIPDDVQVSMAWSFCSIGEGCAKWAKSTLAKGVNVLGYKIESVPCLTREWLRRNKGKDYWYIGSKGYASCTNNKDHIADYSIIVTERGFETEQHAQLALDNKLIQDKDVKRLLFGEE